MKICPYCETENDDNALTCIQCEYEFEVISETVNNTSESISSDFAEKSVQSENECRKPPHKSNSKTGIIALVSVLLVCGVAGGVYYSKNKAKIKAKTAIVTAKNSNKKSNKDAQKKETSAQSETAEDENSDNTVPLTDESSIPETTEAEAAYTTDEIKAMYLEYLSNEPMTNIEYDDINSYALADLNNDGSPEVLMTSYPPYIEYTSEILAIFAINDGHFYYIEGTCRGAFYLCEGNYIHSGGSSGAASYGCSIVRYISGYDDGNEYAEFEYIDSLNFEGDYETGQDVIYHNGNIISQTEADNIMEQWNTQYPEKKFKPIPIGYINYEQYRY